jgi:uncharacterized protein YdhG (YjbR/CyaY superfamily)
MRTGRPKDVSGYIAAAPREARVMLRQLRALVKRLAPGVQEKIGYGMPAYKYLGKPLFYFGAFTQHVGVYAMSGTFYRKYRKELAGYVVSAGTVRFPYGKPLPVSLLKKLITGRMKVTEAQVVKKMTCRRGHVFLKSPVRPTCPVCWPGRYKKPSR